MKKIILVILAIVLCLSLCSCDSLLQKAKSAVTGTEVSERPKDYVTTLENEEYVYELYESYIKLAEYLGEEKDVIVPSEIDGKPVKVIGSFCYYETDLISVKIPSSVETIEEGAFYYVEGLTSVVIPDNVTILEPRAFGWCVALESVKIGNGITEIPDYCFNYCSALKTVTIPSNITKIGVRAFSYCDQLSDITVPDTVESVGDRAFVGCPVLEYVTFKNDSVELGANMFLETPNVVIIANENSNAYNYCVDNNLRWSTSKSVEAIQLGNPNEESESSDISDESVSESEDE